MELRAPRTRWLLAVAALFWAACAATRPAEPGDATGFHRVLEFDGITFRVSCPNDSSINSLSLVPAGLEVDNALISRAIDGTVVGAEVGDLDANGSPEVYVYVRSAGSGSYGSLVAYAANRRKSLSNIDLPPLSDNPRAGRGYMGHDEFSLAGRVLVRRFPVYAPGDTNAAPSGGTRRLEYSLVRGKDGWRLRLDRIAQE